jgi:hypothetical protein
MLFCYRALAALCSLTISECFHSCYYHCFSLADSSAKAVSISSLLSGVGDNHASEGRRKEYEKIVTPLGTPVAGQVVRVPGS